MNESRHPGICVYVCHRCIPNGNHLPRQWNQDGVRVQVTVLPCSGKTDAQYLFHAIEAGAQGVLVVTCPKGECHLSQGNYRAEIRIRTVRRLLAEIGLESERAELVHCAQNDNLNGLIRDAVNRFCALGMSPLGLGAFPNANDVRTASHETAAKS
jgi:coenzyme F420-reducing hydrogenase delta subunit